VDLQLEANLNDVQRRDAESGNKPSYTTGENDLLSAALSGSQLSWRSSDRSNVYLIFEALRLRRHAFDSAPMSEGQALHLCVWTIEFSTQYLYKDKYY
jgi:hypothetical protein